MNSGLLTALVSFNRFKGVNFYLLLVCEYCWAQKALVRHISYETFRNICFNMLTTLILRLIQSFPFWKGVHLDVNSVEDSFEVSQGSVVNPTVWLRSFHDLLPINSSLLLLMLVGHSNMVLGLVQSWHVLAVI